MGTQASKFAAATHRPRFEHVALPQVIVKVLIWPHVGLGVVLVEVVVLVVVVVVAVVIGTVCTTVSVMDIVAVALTITVAMADAVAVPTTEDTTVAVPKAVTVAVVCRTMADGVAVTVLTVGVWRHAQMLARMASP